MTIAEASRKYGLSADALRYYERVGIIPRVPRTKSGIRDYDEASCGWIELTHHVLHHPVVPVEAVHQGVVPCQPGGGVLRGLQRGLRTVPQAEEGVRKRVVYGGEPGGRGIRFRFPASGQAITPPHSATWARRY